MPFQAGTVLTVAQPGAVINAPTSKAMAASILIWYRDILCTPGRSVFTLSTELPAQSTKQSICGVVQFGGALAAQNYVERVDNAGDVAEQREENVQPKVEAQADLQEDAQRR